MPPIGVLALQGDFQKHLDALATCGEAGVEVRTISGLSACRSLIIPGGESTTLAILLERSGLDAEIVSRAESGMPIWGTCMGMILLASSVEGSEQKTLGILDISVRRNAFGAQLFSFEADVDYCGLDSPLHTWFIRAPEVVRVGHGVEVVASHEGHIVGVRRDKILGTSFHPELGRDFRLHALFSSW